MTPISASVLILAPSITDGKIFKLGLTRKPAMIYPSTKGCLIFRKINTTNAATINIKAKSSINFGKCPILRKTVIFPKIGKCFNFSKHFNYLFDFVTDEFEANC